MSLEKKPNPQLRRMSWTLRRYSLMKPVEDANASVRETLRCRIYSARFSAALNLRRITPQEFFCIVGKFCRAALFMRGRKTMRY
jgi:hypothetical protein